MRGNLDLGGVGTGNANVAVININQLNLGSVNSQQNGTGTAV